MFLVSSRLQTNLNETNDRNYTYRFLDVWQVGRACCHPDHKQQDDALPPNHLVSTYFLSEYICPTLLI